MKYLLSLVFLAWAACAAAQSRAEPAYGLIVKLRDAPAHAAVASERESALGNMVRDRERWQSVLSRSRLSPNETRPVGRNAQLLRFDKPLGVGEAEAMAAQLQQQADVEWAVPNVREKLLQASPNDPRFSGQWWLSATASGSSRGVPAISQAWGTSTGGSVTVAVLDTGLVRNHPDLQGERFSAGYDFVTNESGLSNDGDGRDSDFSDPGDAVFETDDCGEPTPSSWHGTAIAGQIGALTNNGVGVAGVNRSVRILTVRVATKCGALVSDILDAMRWAAGLSVSGVPANPHPARVINISFGGSGSCTAYDDTLADLREQGVLVVAAAGNGDSTVERPARCSGALAVAAVNRSGTKTWYSSFGSEIDIATVGGDFDPDMNILTTSNAGTDEPGANTYNEVAGTSFAAPIVAGVASLMLAVNSDLSLDELVDGLKSTARPHVRSSALLQCLEGVSQESCNCTTRTCGAGLLDAPSALDYAEDEAESGGGGGGGALGVAALAGLMLAALGLMRVRRSAQRGR